jgi:uracil-DNA glycosylase
MPAISRTKLDRSLAKLLTEVRGCRACAESLPLGPRPVLRVDTAARVLIVGQAPGIRVHETGIPWNDPSGDRLRQWMQVEREQFYDERRFAIIPMGYCYPGSAERGDLPPRKECSQLWLSRLLAHLPNRRLTLLVGQYAHAHYLGSRRKATLTETVRAWQEYLPDFLPLPHPSGRNNRWLRQNPWFESEVLPTLRRLCRELAL